MVPGDCQIRSPTTWTIGVWMAVMRDGELAVRGIGLNEGKREKYKG
jgi:hypothetical protein